MEFSHETRDKTLRTLQQKQWELLIIGGGVTGAGLALHAAARGIDVALVEMQDFAAGASSRSSKLVHGGLRYLKQFDVKLVADVARERNVIGRNAPHIAQPDYMLMPVYDEEGASFDTFSAEVALHLYDYLAEVDETWAHYMVEHDRVLEEEPALNSEQLKAGGFYLDYTNDDARLTIETIKKAHEMGAAIVNYVKAEAFHYSEDGQINGISGQNTLNGESFEIRADVVVNATGPWSDETRKQGKRETEKKMFPTKGVHFVVDHDKLPVKRTIYTDTGQQDNRMFFIIPRGDKTYFGTTDTPFEGTYEEPSITREDVDYLLKAVNHRFPSANLKLKDIESSWAGLRPLIQDEDNSDPSGISRGHEVFTEEDGLITIAGGKLTDYRRMAEDTFEVIDQAFETYGKTFKEVDTKIIPLSGGDVPDPSAFADFVSEQAKQGIKIGLSEADAAFLADWYGSNVTDLFNLSEEAKTYDLPLKEALQLAYSLKYEMVLAPADFFNRRTGMLFFNIRQIEKLKQPVLDILSERLGWDSQTRDNWEGELNARMQEAALSDLKKETSALK
ncbi:Aerobic glycerol-3-phosphate dehydrogenase [Alkalibacterium sp. AK22]|uniref:FAD-dependent oxidoreductase n=1 Tax=Alkalibacterium sp. AK22 TaxID=1229520 RepID=UPI0004452412|nr:FAD-dependent oxidoreductase [Alkalibacterium sp. AK22]EXJ23484.1 Aerobic glycerol-3-phosphate dehydrogenase [Alkalibacterium sp. AK22]